MTGQTLLETMLEESSFCAYLIPLELLIFSRSTKGGLEDTLWQESWTFPGVLTRADAEVESGPLKAGRTVLDRTLHAHRRHYSMPATVYGAQNNYTRDFTEIRVCLGTAILSRGQHMDSAALGCFGVASGCLLLEAVLPFFRQRHSFLTSPNS